MNTDPPGALVCTVIPGPPAEGDIGEEGGAVVLENAGPAGIPQRHVLTIPDSAVTGSRRRLTMTDAGKTYIAVNVRGPGGAGPFKRPVTLRLSYAGCNVTDPTTLKIYRQPEGSDKWERLDDSRLVPDSAVEVDRLDLSQYALGAG